ncbi:NUDIX hydrolase [Mucilaginibacter sabulilitoris]|uniref:NUDIX hydrolase n=1 Tax=Mucilaginibacter sabulilitoris TaxID=1173583 RepID=A0ABZ0TI82_9SPHI|nr:NUDIX domain-containing protein [Mucilaginibacter sabulilitoris]WPU92346.1 NUDIX hydrolase [Mucilaginibacter sabulilitoris]
MDTISELQDFVKNGYKHYIPHISIDSAIFGYHDHQLKILLSNYKALDGYCLPGGYIKRTETLDEAANRIVMERTGLKDLYLQQYKSFGDPDRIKWSEIDFENFLKKIGVEPIKDSWLMDQTISVGYYALTDFSLVTPQGDFMSDFCAWFNINEIPPLLFDHDQMVKDALHTLRIQLYYYPIAEKLLPQKFTLTEIHSVYETLLGKKLDIRNFPKKLVFLGLIKKLSEKRNIGPHRAPFLYKFDIKTYNKALEIGTTLS